MNCPQVGVGLEGEGTALAGAGRERAVSLGAAGKGDAVVAKQSCDQIGGGGRADILNAQGDGHGFAGIDDAVGGSATSLQSGVEAPATRVGAAPAL